MANSVPMEVPIIGTDDETFAFTLEFSMTDGSSFPFSEYQIEYSLMRDGCQILSLAQGNGITVQAPMVTFRKGDGPLSKGEYQHGCRLRHIATGDLFQAFDGPVSISEGYFR